MKAFACLACKKSKVQCRKEETPTTTTNSCRRCSEKGITCTITNDDKRTNKTNRGELTAIVEKYHHLGVSLLTAMRLIGQQLTDKDWLDPSGHVEPVQVERFAPLAAHLLPAGGRLVDVRQSKQAAEETGIELLGCLYAYCAVAYRRILLGSTIEMVIGMVESSDFSHTRLGFERSDLLESGRCIEDAIRGTGGTTTQAIIAATIDSLHATRGGEQLKLMEELQESYRDD